MKIKVKLYYFNPSLTVQCDFNPFVTQLYYTPDDLRTYVGLSHGGVASQSTQGVNPDNVVKTLAQYIPEGTLHS